MAIIGARKYQLAVALPGQRMSYQDKTVYKGDLDETINGMDSRMPLGRFVCKPATGYKGDLQLPSATHTTVIGVVPQQAGYERNPVTGEGGIPSKFPMAYATEGVFAIEMVAGINAGDDIVIAADDADADNKGKAAPTAYANNSLAVPNNYRVIRVVDNLAIIEIDFDPTLIG